MSILRPAAVAVIALAFAGCSNLAPSSFVPGAVQNQSRSNVNAFATQRTGSTTSRVLYVADIDGQPGVGQILVYSADMRNPQFIRAITSGTGRPFGLWVDGNNILYVANEPNKYPSSVTEF